MQGQQRILHFAADAAPELECQQCAALMGECDERADGFKQRVLAEKRACQAIVAGNPQLYLQPGTQYALAPRQWLARWRSWINSSPWKQQGALAVARGGGGAATAAGAVAGPPEAAGAGEGDAAGGAGSGAPPEVTGVGLQCLTEAMNEVVVWRDREPRLLVHLPILKSHRGRWCQVRPCALQALPAVAPTLFQ